MAKAKARLLIIDDDRSIRRTLTEILEYENYKVDAAGNGTEGLVKIKTQKYDAVLCDIKMPEPDGMEVLDRSQQIKPDLPIIMISGHGDMETAILAVKKGAFDFIAKPLDLNRLLITVRNAMDKSDLITETKVLRRKVTGKIRPIVGDSPSIQHIKDTIERVAPTDARILITGENGTGKEMVARWIHEKSNRKGGSFVEVNCAAIPAELIESELFGHEKGSFTSAHKQRIGKFEQASGGTLFLDEIGDMSLSAQAKVLRALQENKITRVGGDKDISVDVRILSATNKNLLEMVDHNQFRLDLYHRLNVIPIKVPSLNDRQDDVPLLAEQFVIDICEGYNTKPKTIDKAAHEELKKVNWTGNVRELRNVMERLIILSDKTITAADVRTYVLPTAPMSSNGTSTASSSNSGALIDFNSDERLQDFKERMEREYLAFKLKKNNWNVSKTAEEIDIQRSHLYSKIEKYDLKRS